MADEEDCDDDSKCTDNGICSFGKCQCTGTYLLHKILNNFAHEFEKLL